MASRLQQLESIEVLSLQDNYIDIAAQDGNEMVEPIIGPTIEALKNLDPTYIAPAHCTGRKAVMNIERELPDKFLLNMSGTRMIFQS